jgi:hypothetical protein
LSPLIGDLANFGTLWTCSLFAWFVETAYLTARLLSERALCSFQIQSFDPRLDIFASAFATSLELIQGL